MDRNHEQRRTRWNDEIARDNESQCSADWTSQVFPFLYSIIQDWSSVYLKSEAGSSLWKPMISHRSLIRVIIGLSGQSWRHKSMSIFSWFWLDGSYLLNQTEKENWTDCVFINAVVTLITTFLPFNWVKQSLRLDVILGPIDKERRAYRNSSFWFLNLTFFSFINVLSATSTSNSEELFRMAFV